MSNTELHMEFPVIGNVYKLACKQNIKIPPRTVRSVEMAIDISIENRSGDFAITCSPTATMYLEIHNFVDSYLECVEGLPYPECIRKCDEPPKRKRQDQEEEEDEIDIGWKRKRLAGEVDEQQDSQDPCDPTKDVEDDAREKMIDEEKEQDEEHGDARGEKEQASDEPKEQAVKEQISDEPKEQQPEKEQASEESKEQQPEKEQPDENRD